MKKRKKSKAQILTATALKVTPMFLAAALGVNIVYNIVMDDYKGIFELNDLKNEVVSVQGNTNTSDIDIFYDDDTESIDAESTELVGIEKPEISTEMYDSGYKFANIDWATLKAYNEDIVSYIIVDGTNISYPIVQSHDNKEYLELNYRGESDRAGTPMVDYRTTFSANPNTMFDVTAVYGHHMANNVMFADLTKYETQSFYDEHPYLIMYTDDGQAYRIDVVAVNIISGEDDTPIHVGNFASEADFNKYNSRIMYSSIIKTNETLEYGDKVMTLVTCTYGYGTNKRCQVIGKVTKVLVNEELLAQNNVEYQKTR